MFARLILLISLLVPCVTLADSHLDTKASGFLYNTTWEDKDLHDNRTVLGVNLSAEYKNFAVRTQLANTDEPIRRLTLEYSQPIVDSSTEGTIRVGRFGRVESFYSNVLDTPSSWQMAVLPFAGYSYRMFNGSFVLLDGVQGEVKHKFSSSILTLKASRGKMVIDNQKDLQREAFGRYSKDFEMEPENGVYDFSARYDTKYVKTYIARQVYRAKLEANNRTPLNNFIAARFRDSEYILDRFGVRVDYKDYFVSTELSLGDSSVTSDNGRKVAETDAIDKNFVVGKYFNNLSIYGGHSIGENRSAGHTNRDSFLGGTYNWDNVTVSLAKHNGKGKGWAKYSTSSLGEYSWNSWVLSTTIRF